MPMFNVQIRLLLRSLRVKSKLTEKQFHHILFSNLLSESRKKVLKPRSKILFLFSSYYTEHMYTNTLDPKIYFFIILETFLYSVFK